MGTHNIRFYGGMMIINAKLSSDALLICSSDYSQQFSNKLFFAVVHVDFDEGSDVFLASYIHTVIHYIVPN